MEMTSHLTKVTVLECVEPGCDPGCLTLDLALFPLCFFMPGWTEESGPPDWL